jgi:hypothetical protein
MFRRKQVVAAVGVCLDISPQRLLLSTPTAVSTGKCMV